MLPATTLITSHRSSNNESGKDAVFLALSLFTLSVHANAIKAENKMKKYFFIESDKIKKSNFEKPKLDFYKKKYFLLAYKIKIVYADLIRYCTVRTAIFYIISKTYPMFLGYRSI